MAARDPYNAEVRRRFENPVHAGDPQGVYDQVIEGAASESANGAQLLLSAGMIGGKIASLRFRARGCPHLIAAADWFCSRFEGLEPSQLAEVRLTDLSEILEVPVTKSGRLLLIEDAAKGLLAAARQHQSGHE